MKSLLIRIIIFALALYGTSYLITGIGFESYASVLMAAIVLSIINAIIRPILFFLTLPLNIVTLGLFTFVLNGFMLKLAAAVVPGFDVAGFWAATLGALILTVLNAILTGLISSDN